MDTANVQAFKDYLYPTGYKWSNIDRSASGLADLGVLASGTLELVAVPLPGGATVTKVAFLSGGTALSGGNNQWAVLLNSSRNQLAISADATSGAWAANTLQAFTFSSSFLTETPGLYYVGLLVNATTPPSLVGVTQDYGVTADGLAPIIEGRSTTGLTNPASLTSPATALTARGQKPWVLVG